MQLAVIMSTYNGERYLREQIESILNQEGVHLDLYIRDDGSSDRTVDIIDSYADARIHVFKGGNKGFARSFVECLHIAEGYDYYAFSDQDDFWEKEKLRKAIDFIEENSDRARPCLYYSNLKVSDTDLNVQHITKLENRNQSLSGVSMRRSIAGCTMVFNQQLWKEIFRNPISEDILLQGHDSFIISLCYALGGSVYCDHNAYIRYRQHKNNTAGAPLNISRRLKKEYKALQHDKVSEVKIARELLKGWGDKIPAENKDVLRYIANMGCNGKTKAHILFSREFDTGDIRLTLLEKLKVLIMRGGVIRKIDNSALISFDVFDTLISRDVSEPNMIFHLMEQELSKKNKPYYKGFHHVRESAEYIANHKYHGCASINQIYEEVAKKLGLNNYESDELIQLEKDLELSLCTPKYEGKVLYEYCQWTGKQIILISDMYLPKEQIHKMLSICGYHNIDIYSIFVSCEVGNTKRDGSLYEDVASSLNIDKKTWTHIGDARRSDWLMPLRYGISSIHVPHTINHFAYKSRYREDNTYSRIHTHLLNSRLPWIRDQYERFGYECMGPLLVGFIEWLNNELKKQKEQGNYDKIYFLAREGQLLKKAFDIVNEENIATYLPVSRKALSGCSLWIYQGIVAKLESIPFPDEFGIDQIEDKLEINLPDALKDRYSARRFVSWKEVVLCKDMMEWLEAHEEDINAYSKRQYELFLQLLNIDSSVKRIAVIDIGWKGTMQHSLEQLLSQKHKTIKVDGYYLGVSRNAGKKYPRQSMKGFLFHETDENKVFAFSGLLEGIMTADHGSVRRYECKDKINYSCYPYEYEGENRITRIQKGALEAMKDVNRYLRVNTDWKNVSEKWSVGRIVKFGYSPTMENIKMFQNFSFFDGDEYSITGEGNKSLRQFITGFRKSSWKTAYLKQHVKWLPFTSQMYIVARNLRDR